MSRRVARVRRRADRAPRPVLHRDDAAVPRGKPSAGTDPDLPGGGEPKDGRVGAAGAARAGRDVGEVELVQSVITSVADDPRDAIEGAKIQIAFYGTTRTYRPVLDHHGFGDVVDPLREAYAAGDLDRMRALVSDEMVQTYAVAGTPDDVRAGLARFDGLADQLMLNTPWAGPDLTRSVAIFEQLIATFATG